MQTVVLEKNIKSSLDFQNVVIPTLIFDRCSCCKSYPVFTSMTEIGKMFPDCCALEGQKRTEK